MLVVNSRRRGARFALLIFALLAGVTLAPISAATAESFLLDRTLHDSRIIESSGLTRSSYARSTLFTHNDSGDLARVFAVDNEGRTQAVITLSGIKARDWEDIATGPDHTLWVGDIGDNRRIRDTISVIRFVEPKSLTNTSVAAKSFVLKYPDGAHNAEGLMVNPISGQLYVVTKATSGAGIYAAPSTLSGTQPNVLRRVAGAPSLIKAASFSPDGSRFALSGGSIVYVYRSIGGSAVQVQKPPLKQGESVAVMNDGNYMTVGSEGADSPVFRMPIP